MDKLFYSTHRNSKLIKEATDKLIQDNFDMMIKYVYDKANHKTILGHPEIRIGLVIKLLHNINAEFEQELLDPVFNDIKLLSKSTEYLNKTGDSQKRLKCLSEEAQFLERYVKLDTEISLNSKHIVKSHDTKPHNIKNISQHQSKINTPKHRELINDIKYTDTNNDDNDNNSKNNNILNHNDDNINITRHTDNNPENRESANKINEQDTIKKRKVKKNKRDVFDTTTVIIDNKNVEYITNFDDHLISKGLAEHMTYKNHKLCDNDTNRTNATEECVLM